MQKCKKCGRPLLTATSQCDPFYPDSEPYESGVEQETEYESIDEYVAVGILWCPEHGIQHVWIQEPPPKEKAHGNTRGTE